MEGKREGTVGDRIGINSRSKEERWREEVVDSGVYRLLYCFGRLEFPPVYFTHLGTLFYTR